MWPLIHRKGFVLDALCCSHPDGRYILYICCSIMVLRLLLPKSPYIYLFVTRGGTHGLGGDTKAFGGLLLTVTRGNNGQYLTGQREGWRRTEPGRGRSILSSKTEPQNLFATLLLFLNQEKRSRVWNNTQGSIFSSFVLRNEKKEQNRSKRVP